MNHVFTVSFTWWDLLFYVIGFALACVIRELFRVFYYETRAGQQLQHVTHRLFNRKMHDQGCRCKGRWLLP